MTVSMLFHVAILGFLSLLLVLSIGYPFQLRLVPWIFIALASFFELVLVVKELRQGATGSSGDSGLRVGECLHRLRGVDRGYLAATTWILGFCAALYLFGFIVSMPLFTIIYLKTHDNSWTFSIGVSIAVWAVFFSFFVFGLKVSIYPGKLYLLLS